MKIPIVTSSSMSGDEGDDEVHLQQVEPNVGNGTPDRNPLSAKYLELKELFSEIMGNDMSSNEIAALAMKEARKFGKGTIPPTKYIPVHS